MSLLVHGHRLTAIDHLENLIGQRRPSSTFVAASLVHCRYTLQFAALLLVCVKALRRWRKSGWPNLRYVLLTSLLGVCVRQFQFRRLPQSIAHTSAGQLSDVHGGSQEPKDDDITSEGSFVTQRNSSESLQLHYYVAEPICTTSADIEHQCPPRTLVLVNGIGVNFRFWTPIVAVLRRRGWRVVSWDYAGLFQSALPPGMPKKRMAIREHSQDLEELLAHLGVLRADMLLGWSMGVTVALDFALHAPRLVNKLFLMTGSHGAVGATGLQLLGRWLPLQKQMRSLCRCALTHTGSVRPFVEKLWGLREFVKLQLRPWSLVTMQRYLEDFGLRYFHDNWCTEDKARAWIHTGLALDECVTYESLPSIKQQTFIVSGFWDFITPAYCSIEMVGRMPNAQHHCYATSTHFVLFEHQALLLKELVEFANYDISAQSCVTAE